MNSELEKLFASASRVEAYLRSGLVSREVAYAQLLAIRTVDDAGRVWTVLPHNGALKLHLLAPGAAPVLADPASFVLKSSPTFSVWKKLRGSDVIPSSVLVRAGALLVGFGALLVWLFPSAHSKGMAMVHQDPPVVMSSRCSTSCNDELVVTLEDSRVPGESSLSSFCASARPTLSPIGFADLGSTVECHFAGCDVALDGGGRWCRTTP